MRGSPCPEAWALPVPERVDPKVRTKPHKGQLSSSREAGWQRGSTARNPRDFSPGSPQYPYLTQRTHTDRNVTVIYSKKLAVSQITCHVAKRIQRIRVL